jgi:carboxyl-terminal processing protease
VIPERLTRRRYVAAVALALMAAVLPRTGTAQAPLAVETFDAAWTIIRDSHFDETMNGLDWDRVASELRPRAAVAASTGVLRAVLREMLGRLQQSHFALIPATADRAAGEPGNLGGSPGMDVRLIGADLVVTRVEAGGGAAEAGVRPGWLLRAVDGTPMAALLGPLSETLEPRLLLVEAWRLAQTRLRGPRGSTARLTFEDGTGREVQVPVERRPDQGSPVTVGNLPTMFVRVEAHRAGTPAARSVGVIRFNVWMAAVDSLFQDAVDDFRKADGIIIDLRGNPGGLAAMLMGISGHFIDERRVLGVMKTRDNELRFVVNPRRVNARGERVAPFAGPVAILIDGLSGSASECFAGGMQSVGRVRVFGEPSMGQALPALFSRLPNGDVLIHAYGDFVTADGTRLEGRGVVPDDVVPVAREHLLAGRDPVMEAALAWMDAAAGRRAASLLQ